jgi:hypothetical protein
MVDDAVISREASLMFQNLAGFEPVNNNLLHWKGYAKDKNNQPVDIELKVPEKYPYDKPEVNVITQNNTIIPIRTRKLSRWRPDFYLFQVANEALKIVSEGAFASSVASTTQVNEQANEELQTLQRQKNNLENLLRTKEEELLEIRQNKGTNLTYDNSDVEQIIKDTVFQLEMDIASLEDDYDRLEIDGSEFAKNFIDIRKRILLLQLS